MARNTFTQYRALISKPMPTCEGKAIIFNFGTECTQITTDTADDFIVRSSDMCINPEGVYVAASYRAYPGKKTNGDLLFSSTLTHKPVLFPPGASCDKTTAPVFCF